MVCGTRTLAETIWFLVWILFFLSPMFVFFFFCRGQDQHIRYEHIYLPEPSGQSEVEYAEIKRPRLDMGPESVMRPSSHRPPLPLVGAEDMTKVSRWYEVERIK